MGELIKWGLDWTCDFQISDLEVTVEGKKADVTSERMKTKLKSQTSSLMNIYI